MSVLKAVLKMRDCNLGTEGAEAEWTSLRPAQTTYRTETKA